MDATLPQKTLTMLFLVYFCLAGMAEIVPVDSHDEIANGVITEPQVLDFGRVNESEKRVELSFALKNSSNRDINIVSVKTGCGCTSAKMPQSMLKAGASISIPVAVNISGRRGEFEENAQIEIAEHDEQIIVPIKGVIVHDLWFEQPMISLSVKDSGTSVEKVFEIHTTDYPTVQFDLKLHEEALSIKELERTKNDGRTTIKFLLKVSDIPIERSTSHYRLVLSPTAPEIRPLVIPVVCYRPLRQSLVEQVPEGELLPPLSPERVGLGVMRAGSDKQFQISSDPDLLDSVRINGIKGFPKNVKVEMMSELQPDDTRTVTVHVDETAVSGLMDGVIEFGFADGQTRSIVVVGLVVAAPSSNKP